MKELDRHALEFGTKFWTSTFRVGLSMDQAWDLIGDGLQSAHEAGVPAAELESERRLMCSRGLGWAQWAHAGFPTVQIDERFAAALMASQVSGDVAGDLEVPWEAFEVRVPRGLLECPLLGSVYDRVWVLTETIVHSSSTLWKRASAIRMMDSDSGYEQIVVGPNVAGILFGPELEDRCPEFEDDPDGRMATQRLILMCRRLVAGALYSLQFTNNFRVHERALKRRHVGRDGPPTHRVTVIGRPISVDCRPWIRSFLTGRKSALPSVQSLVRGHYKRQVIGISRSGRKVIWVEPYWRGPEDAPILARPYKVGPPDQEASG